MKTSEIWDAQITGIHLHQIVEGGPVAGRIHINGTMHPELADNFGVKSLLFHRNGTPVEGFDQMALAAACQACRLVFESDPALKQSFELLGDSCDHFVVDRQAEGVLRLKMRLNFHGDPHSAIAYWCAIGNGESMLKIAPLQQHMDDAGRESDESEEDEKEEEEFEADAETPTARERKPRQKGTERVPQEAVRNAMTAGRRGRKPAAAAEVQ